MLEKLEGVLTALETPFRINGNDEMYIDYDGLELNARFQKESGVGMVPTGTTGESPTLDWREHDNVVSNVAQYSDGMVPVIAGTGSNSTREALRASEIAKSHGIEGVLLVDCYYNGPSSFELRTKYYELVAKRFPGLAIIPYIIPGRTGTKMEPEDLAILARNYPNVIGVKEATGSIDNMVKTRKLLGKGFAIMSGDDDKTYEMMTRDSIKAAGVISVFSNVVPGAVKEMVESIKAENYERAKQLRYALEPLFQIVTVTTRENYEGFEEPVPCKWRNPVPIKTLMNGLGMPAGPCRQPLGKMSANGVAVVRNALIKAYERDKNMFLPIEDHYGIKVEQRIGNDKYWT